MMPLKDPSNEVEQSTETKVFRTMTPIRVHVDPVQLFCAQAGGDAIGDGGNLEIYGHIGAWAKFAGAAAPRVEHFFLHQEAEGRQSITMGSTLLVGDHVDIDVQDNENFFIGGHLKEFDPFPGVNDDMLDRMVSFHHDQIVDPNTTVFGVHTIRFEEGNQKVDAIFTVRRG
jgi:hypothetical protein